MIFVLLWSFLLWKEKNVWCIYVCMFQWSYIHKKEILKDQNLFFLHLYIECQLKDVLKNTKYFSSNLFLRKFLSRVAFVRSARYLVISLGIKPESKSKEIQNWEVLRDDQSFFALISLFSVSQIDFFFFFLRGG